MPRVSTDRLQVGMVLGDDVKDLSGRLLLTAGTELQEKQLKVLRTWGVLGVDIVGDSDVEAGEQYASLEDLPAECRLDIEREVERRFIGVDVSHPVMATLVGLVESDLVKQYCEKGEID